MDPGSVILGGIGGGIVGWLLKPTNGAQAAEYKVLPIPIDKEFIRTRKPAFYKKITLDMATARSQALKNWEFVEQADAIVVLNHSASVACNIRLNEPEFHDLDVRDFKSFEGYIWRFFITNTAGTGSIDLLLCRGAAFNAILRDVESHGFETLRTDKDSHFSGAIAQNATEEEDITGLTTNRIRITRVTILSDENLDYRLLFFNKDSFADTDLDDDRFIDELELDLPSYGFQIAGAGQYMMTVNGLEIDYDDQDGSRELHIALQCLSAAGKTAGANGEVVVIFTYEERE